MTLGERLTAWRLGLAEKTSQTKAAKAAGISQSVWSELENDEIERVGLDVAERIVKVTAGAIRLEHFPRPRGKRVKPIVQDADSGTDVSAPAARAS